ncbi:male-specific lethal 3 [Biomphalaria glabrata]|uniref:Uncharacterized protein n=1 Tax=Biomphalaria glabrata TaxID=6526 RepID=A0A2C9LI02_BIOGL|nr:putative male-specific lethal 3 [Biomphalaria glabrata]
MAGRNIRYEYDIGEIVLCFEPDATKARVLYDAKVVEQRQIKDASGKKKPAYVVHFQGWNSSWDRQVGEHYLLRNTDENRELMRKLAETAKKFSRKNSQRRRKINSILHEAFGGAPPELDVLTESEDSEEESDTGKKVGKIKTSQERKRLKSSSVEFDIPDSLKIQLEDDYNLINKKNKLTQIPAKPCVVEVLESFMKTFCVNFLCDPSAGREKTRTSSSKHTLKCSPDKCISLCKEFVDSLRIIFDFTLPIILLYAAEQQQYESAMKDIKLSDLHTREISSNSESQKKPSSSHGKVEKTPRQHHHQQESTSLLPSSPSEPAAETPARRVTRRSVHEVPKVDCVQPAKSTKTHTQPAAVSGNKSPRQAENSPTKSGPEVHHEQIVPIASRTRRKAHFEVVEVSSGVIVKQEPSSDLDMEVTTIDLPTFSQNEDHLMNGQEAACSAAGTESLTLGSSRGREDAMDRILGWQLLPLDIVSNGPVNPSQIYGTVHLLRMFVKLPELLKKMNIKDVQLQIIIKFIHHCLHYLVDHQSELFHEHTYIKAKH